MTLPKLAEYLEAKRQKRKVGRKPITPPTVIAERNRAVPREVSFTISGAPRTKKNSRQHVRVKGKTVPLPSAAFRRWQRECRITPELVLPDVPYNVRAVFYRDADRGDAVGYYQGLGDLLQYHDVIANDRCLAQWDGSRLALDRDNPRVEVTLTPLALPTPERP